MFSKYILALDFFSGFQQLESNQPFQLENGKVLNNITIGFHTYGNLISDSRVIWVCHALTGNSQVTDWWGGIFGEGKLFDPTKDFIVCANVIGSCYGSTGPVSTNGEQLYFNDFPTVTTRDMANAHELLRAHLQLNKIDLLIGASLGGQQALEFSILLKDKLKDLVLIATNAFHSPFGIAFNESQRLAIQTDSTYGNGNIDDAQQGLKVARSIAMISYRSYEGYKKTQSEEDNSKIEDFKASSYQRYQGEKLAKRFNAYAYETLSKAMDSHNVGRNREGGVIKALSSIQARTLVIGIDSDLLFPISEQLFLKEYISNAHFKSVSSDFGHDGFLVENDQLTSILNDFVNNDFKNNRITRLKKLN